MIENNLDKAKIKYDTAQKIQSTYKDIVNCLEDVSFEQGFLPFWSIQNVTEHYYSLFINSFN